MPGTGARPDHRYPVGPVWAPYRLPFAGARGLIDPRLAGVAFEGEPGGDGATPPAGQPPATPPATPPTAPPATGAPDPDADGMTTDAGRRALAAERKRAAELQKRVEELEGQTASDAEKATKQAVKDAVSERDTYWAERIRRSEARSALRAAGVTNDKDLDLAANAPEFAALTVDEQGTVTDLAKAVEQFKKDHPAIFAAPAPAVPPGAPTRGPQNGTGAPADRPKGLSEAVAAHFARPT